MGDFGQHKPGDRESTEVRTGHGYYSAVEQPDPARTAFFVHEFLNVDRVNNGGTVHPDEIEVLLKPVKWSGNNGNRFVLVVDAGVVGFALQPNDGVDGYGMLVADQFDAFHGVLSSGVCTEGSPIWF